MKKTTFVVSLLALMTAAAPTSAQNSGPKSVYWVDATTVGGFAAAGAGGTMGMMGAMMGGGGFDSMSARQLELRLGSGLTPTGGPKADHFIPPGMKMGRSLPLKTPTPGRREGGESAPYQLPKARLFLYWGCGDNAPKGQPLIFDFSKIAAGQLPPTLPTRKINAPDGPRPSNWRSYGDWPNDLDRDPNKAFVKKDSSLVGPHQIKGTYTPDINFTLAPGQDFMEPMIVKTSNRPNNAKQATWKTVPNATGYYGMVVGAKGDTRAPSGPPGEGEQPTDLVMWSSSAKALFAGDLSDFIPPGEVAKLVQEKIVLPPDATTCTVPAEVIRDVPQGVLFMTAYGPEANFAFPPRPSDPKVPWNLEWTTKVRFKSQTMSMLGMDMEAMMAGADDEDAPTPPPEEQKNSRSRALGKALGGALGGILRP